MNDSEGLRWGALARALLLKGTGAVSMQETKEKRAFERARARALCDLAVDGEIHRGFVLDVSARGLFVQTRAPIPCDRDIEVTLHHFGPDPVLLSARVVRRQAAHRATTVVERRGVGLEILAAGEDFYRILREILG